MTSSFQEYPLPRSADLVLSASLLMFPLAGGTAVYAALAVLLGGIGSGGVAGELSPTLDQFGRIAMAVAAVIAVLAAVAGTFGIGLFSVITSRALVAQVRAGAATDAAPGHAQWKQATESPFGPFAFTGTLFVVVPGGLLIAAVLFGPSGQKPPWMFLALLPVALTAIGLWWASRENREHKRRRKLLTEHWSAAITERRERGHNAYQARANSGGVHPLRAALGSAAVISATIAVFTLQLLLFLQYPLAHDTGAGYRPGLEIPWNAPIQTILDRALWIVLGFALLAAVLAAAQLVLDILQRRGTRPLLERAARSGRTSAIDAAVVARASERHLLPETALGAALAGVLLATGMALLQLGVTAATWLCAGGAMLLVACVFTSSIAMIRSGPQRRALIASWGLEPQRGTMQARFRRFMDRLPSSDQ